MVNKLSKNKEEKQEHKARKKYDHHPNKKVSSNILVSSKADIEKKTLNTQERVKLHMGNVQCMVYLFLIYNLRCKWNIGV